MQPRHGGHLCKNGVRNRWGLRETRKFTRAALLAVFKNNKAAIKRPCCLDHCAC
ncbi:hypothetical protein UCMB321_0763 [Pseudomonas batumici]|uniref:Uncharacterized protein n=1 Tax=Pseudomonas batumici TaxID=226910 RepID=A0A0C2EHG3_9PSED|nr:hypothetical protein UCMB321_0763 [Pseudomonas batumici]